MRMEEEGKKKTDPGYLYPESQALREFTWTKSFLIAIAG
jgi:hypothetical protein